MADYNINYEDERLTQLGNQKENAINEMNSAYSGMISEADKYYQAQIDASKEWAQTQQNLQNQQTEFAIQEINQNKEQARKDYLKEQSGSYVDWQKQANKYGAEAERMAASGLTGTGYSESSQVAMYNQYQNRVAVARESYNLAVQNYNNAITNAMLQNNSILAEIAYQSFQTELELSLQGFQYKNTLLLDQMDKKTALEDTYWRREQDVLTQLYNERDFAYRQEQDAIANDQWEKEFAETVNQNAIRNEQWQAEFDETVNQNAIENEQWQAEFDHTVAQDAFENEQREREYRLAVDKYNTANEQWEKEYKLGVDKYNSSLEQFEREMARLEASDEADKAYKMELLQIEKDKQKQDHEEWLEEMKLDREKLDLQKEELEEIKIKTEPEEQPKDEPEIKDDTGNGKEDDKSLLEKFPLLKNIVNMIDNAGKKLSADSFDEASIKANLGKDYTAAEINDLIGKGYVEEYVTEGGKIAFRWTEKGKKNVSGVGKSSGATNVRTPDTVASLK